MILPFVRGSSGSSARTRRNDARRSLWTRSDLQRSRRLSMEPLEERQLLSVSPVLQDDKTVVFSGDAGADSLYLRAASDGVLEFSQTGLDGSYGRDLNLAVTGDQTLSVSTSALIRVALAGGDDTLVTAFSDPVNIEFDGGDGRDTLSFSDLEDGLVFVTRQSGGVTVTDAQYTVNDDGRVALTGGSFTVAASDVEDLVGGNGDNTYVFEHGAVLDGAIDGGTGGNNTLDYSPCVNPVVVDLSSGTATSTASVGNIQNVIGGSR